MRFVAGVDVGNTTTEVVVVDAALTPPAPIAWDRAPTRGAKGSVEALRGAAGIVRRLERRSGQAVDLVAAAPQRPVETRATSVPEAAPPTGRLEIIRAAGDTPGGTGVAVGVPVWAGGPPQRMDRPVVLLVRAGSGFRVAVDAVHAWTTAGTDVRGLLLADDEGVLVSARLKVAVPVADQVDVHRAAVAVLVAVEVRPPGHALQVLADPIRLSALLGLDDAERPDAVRLAAALGDASRGVIAVHASRIDAAASFAGEVLLRDDDADAGAEFDATVLASLPVGAVRRCTPPGFPQADSWDVDDLWVVGMREVATSVAARIDSDTARAVVLAALRASPVQVMPDVVLGEELGVAVRLIRAESVAARAGALTTPGAREGSIVADLGGGTIDVIGGGDREVVAAGGGEMLTAAVAAYLRLPRGAADWVKRGPCSRLEAPQVMLAEDGVRTFLERPAPLAAVGSLVAEGPAGLLPFGGSLAPAAWRSLRLRLKQRVLADNLARAMNSLTALGEQANDVLLVGGVVGDEELLGLLRPVLPGVAVGRADVAGRLGHRYAVAYGLALLATR
ncbi:MAG: hypothetical protein QOJ62_897 [Actinomycetota bacterium]|nr:hypothetical protein [Actinomycetota bacterium]